MNEKTVTMQELAARVSERASGMKPSGAYHWLKLAVAHPEGPLERGWDPDMRVSEEDGDDLVDLALELITPERFEEWLSPLRDVRREVEEAQTVVAAAREQRNDLIRALHDRGLPLSKIAEEAGVSRAFIYNRILAS